jgi:hypothetical protein
MIVNEWSPRFKKQYGGSFPTSYICFDTEFTGNSQDTDLVLEIGHVMVEDNKVVDNKSFILNWYKTDIQSSWLDYKLQNLRGIVGSGWRLLPTTVKAEGHDPISVLNFYHELFTVCRQKELPFVAQNGIWADEKMIRSNFNRYLNRSFDIPASGYFDTGLIFKATRVWDPGSSFANYKSIMLPVSGETLRDYFLRVAGVRIAGLKWNLSSILSYYGLDKLHNIDPDSMHSAGYDAMCLHYIMQHYRSIIKEEEIEPQPSVIKPSNGFLAEELGTYIDEEIKNINAEIKPKRVENFSAPPKIERPQRSKPAVSPAHRRKQRPV